jgi:hypothetical protein
MQVSDEHFRGRTVIAAHGQAIGEVVASLSTPPHGLSSRSRSNCIRRLPNSLALPGAAFALPHSSYPSASSSR